MTGTDERGQLWGIEWDFLAVDATGSVALLSSAGYGPIPARVLDQRPLVERAVSELEALPPVGAADDRRDPSNRSGDYADWFTMSERGLFAYDWRVHHGPYTLVSAPTVTLELSALGRTIREAATLLALPLRFAGASRITLE